jgi:hypothetical protein
MTEDQAIELGRRLTKAAGWRWPIRGKDACHPIEVIEDGRSLLPDPRGHWTCAWLVFLLEERKA